MVFNVGGTETVVGKIKLSTNLSNVHTSGSLLLQNNFNRSDSYCISLARLVDTSTKRILFVMHKQVLWTFVGVF